MVEELLLLQASDSRWVAAYNICLHSPHFLLICSTLDRSCLRLSPGLPFCWLWDCCYSFWSPGFVVNPPSDWELTSISDNAGFPRGNPAVRALSTRVLPGTFGGLTES